MNKGGEGRCKRGRGQGEVGGGVVGGEKGREETF